MLFETAGAQHLKAGIVGAEVTQRGGGMLGTGLIYSLFSLTEGESAQIHGSG
jgi:hypothetical protein